MKNKIILLLIFFASGIFKSQSKEEFKKQAETFSVENAKLKTELAKLKTEKVNQKKEVNFAETNSIADYQDALSEINRLLLFPLFQDKYAKQGYFDRNGFEELKVVKSFANDLAVLNGIKLDMKVTEADRNLAEKSLTYLHLYNIYRSIVENEKYSSFFNIAYDEKTAIEYKNELLKLDFSQYGKFNEDKEKLIEKIDKYRKETCAINSKLILFQNKVLPNLDSANKSQKLNILKSETSFEYIKTVISNLSSSTNIKEKLPCSSQEKSEIKPQSEKDEKSKGEVNAVNNQNVNKEVKTEIKENDHAKIEDLKEIGNSSK